MKTKLQLARSFQTSLKFLVGFYTGYKNRTKNHLIDLENAETNKQKNKQWLLWIWDRSAHSKISSLIFTIFAMESTSVLLCFYSAQP